MHNTRLLTLSAFCLLLALASSCAKPVDPGYSKLLQEVAAEKPPSANTLGGGDKVEIRVYREEKLGGEFVVSPEGTINFPLVGKLEVDGLTCAGVEDNLTNKLSAGYLQSPSVTCSVLEYNSKKVFVFGEVKQPGNFRFVDNMSVVQAIADAGGLSNRAAPDDATLVRVVQGKKVKVRVPVEAIMSGEVENLVLMPGDILVIPESVY